MAVPKIPYTTLSDIVGTIGLSLEDVPDVNTHSQSLSILVSARLLIKLPNHEQLADTENGLALLKAWSTLYGALQLTVVAPSLFITSSTFEGHTETSSSRNVTAIRDFLTAQLNEIEGTLKSVGATVATTNYAIMGRASPAYNPITGV